MKETALRRVTSATPDLDSAKSLARSAVAARLAGNAQIVGPVISMFRHLGEAGEGEEYPLTLSTTAAAHPALEAHLVEHHPWENPEITAIPLAAASDAYAQLPASAVSPAVRAASRETRYGCSARVAARVERRPSGLLRLLRLFGEHAGEPASRVRGVGGVPDHACGRLEFDRVGAVGAGAAEMVVEAAQVCRAGRERIDQFAADPPAWILRLGE